MALVTLTISNSYAFDPCVDRVDHKPRADVNYNPSPITVPERIKFPLTIDIAERYDLNIPKGVEMNAEIGMIEIDADGHIFYNGEYISQDIKDRCDNNEQSKETENGDNTNP